MNGYTSRVSQQQQLGIYEFSSEAPETRLTLTVQKKKAKKKSVTATTKGRSEHTRHLNWTILFSVKKKIICTASTNYAFIKQRTK